MGKKGGERPATIFPPILATKGIPARADRVGYPHPHPQTCGAFPAVSTAAFGSVATLLLVQIQKVTKQAAKRRSGAP